MKFADKIQDNKMFVQAKLKKMKSNCNKRQINTKVTTNINVRICKVIVTSLYKTTIDYNKKQIKE